MALPLSQWVLAIAPYLRRLFHTKSFRWGTSACGTPWSARDSVLASTPPPTGAPWRFSGGAHLGWVPVLEFRNTGLGVQSPDWANLCPLSLLGSRSRTMSSPHRTHPHPELTHVFIQQVFIERLIRVQRIQVNKRDTALILT